jgi:hypothetical protein
MMHHGEGAVVEDDRRAEGVDGDIDDQVLAESEARQLHNVEAFDDDFAEEAPGVESFVGAEERAARQAARLLAKKTGLGAGVAVVNRLSASLDNMYYIVAWDNFFTFPALF